MRKMIWLSASLAIGMMGLLLASWLVTATPASAQPGRRTPMATGIGRPTLDTGGAQATLNAAATSAAGMTGGIEQTAQAILTQIPAQPSFPNDMVAATGEFIATQAQGIAVTPLAIDTASLSPEQQQILNTFLQYGSVNYDPATQTATLSAELSETAINAILDQAVTTAGYNPNDVSADLVTGGAVVTLYNIDLQQNGQTGTLVVGLAISAVNGEIQVEIVSADYQGRSIPPALLENMGLSSDFATQLNTTVTGNSTLDYTINTLVFTETSAVISISVSVAP